MFSIPQVRYVGENPERQSENPLRGEWLFPSLDSWLKRWNFIGVHLLLPLKLSCSGPDDSLMCRLCQAAELGTILGCGYLDNGNKDGGDRFSIPSSYDMQILALCFGAEYKFHLLLTRIKSGPFKIQECVSSLHFHVYTQLLNHTLGFFLPTSLTS